MTAQQHATTCDYLVRHGACTCQPPMSETRSGVSIVTSEQAENALKITRGQSEYERNLLHTIATEPDRTRAAVIDALANVEALRVLWDGDPVLLVADDVANALHQAMTGTHRDGTPL